MHSWRWQYFLFDFVKNCWDWSSWAGRLLLPCNCDDDCFPMDAHWWTLLFFHAELHPQNLPKRCRFFWSIYLWYWPLILIFIQTETVLRCYDLLILVVGKCPRVNHQISLVVLTWTHYHARSWPSHEKLTIFMNFWISCVLSILIFWRDYGYDHLTAC